MNEWLSTSFDRIQVVCWLLGGGLLLLAAGLKVPRVYARAVMRIRELHGELCECLFCDQLSELRARLEQVEQELDDLRAQGTMSTLSRVPAGCAHSDAHVHSSRC
jgi:hypothetical protein